MCWTVTKRDTESCVGQSERDTESCVCDNLGGHRVTCV